MYFRFPWESAYTGTEVTNPCCPEVATQEIHISADIAVALQQFYATTYKRDWLCNTAWPLIREIASFLQSRVTWKRQTKQFHVLSKYWHIIYLYLILILFPLCKLNKQKRCHGS